MDTDTDENSNDDDDEDLDVEKKFDEFDDEIENINIECESKIEDFKGKERMPCHLYFDLEFNIQENAEKNGDEMIDILILIVFECLLKKYNIEGDTNWIVELDSYTKDKFSRHLIIRLLGIAFKDNRHVGAFVKHICLRIHYARGRDKKFKQLFISKDSSPADSGYLFIDNVVYSKNRCFRLHLSSKAWKNSVLLPTGRFKCKEMSEEDVFMLSLICNVEAECEKLLTCNMDIGFINVLKYDTELKFEAVMYVVDLQRNVYYLKCYDPDCRGYRSPFRVVPPDVMFKSFRIGEQNESQMDIREKDDWWFEAMLVAEKVENKPRNLVTPNEHNKYWDEDDNWWMFAETTASEIERAYYGQT
ncbi:hypothetical protein Tco_0968557 [Tanacetum coccineum]